ncbi:hypothetical protein M8R55_21535 [Enterobacter hormaechei]|jgi:Na+/H+ antiporter NhaD/arsenite permease-like protein|uniref:Uncharacterized protein n=1 Tax=Salmonella enterica TaxID=28901 RepID=A0A750MDY9_SALER|nr:MULTISPECIES: hypothetical protein [Enterobacter cloacae complex]EHT9986586.1 hypothetical protein [Salmonella enterica subsp. enterica serovar Derby]EJC1546116.1 hypothetical protein [Salmonella enterica subsp. enterica serovar Montevideo]HAF6252714.1 hypothetical protein [Salmonella enterica]AOQ02292.1 hypothetical protein BFV65_21990 [Enterobacter hormaechei subsp. hoffmannii]ASQ79526.1 hypothetical protein B1023_24460 [Enterobacter hormaechei]
MAAQRTSREGVSDRKTKDVNVSKKRKLADRLYGAFLLLCMVAVVSLFFYGQSHNSMWSIVAFGTGGILWCIAPEYYNRPDIDSKKASEGEGDGMA